MRPGNGSELEIKGVNCRGPAPNRCLPLPPKTNSYNVGSTTIWKRLRLQVMKPSTLFPENPSEFMMNVILLHAVKDSIGQSA